MRRRGSNVVQKLLPEVRAIARVWARLKSAASSASSAAAMTLVSSNWNVSILPRSSAVACSISAGSSGSMRSAIRA